MMTCRRVSSLFAMTAVVGLAFVHAALPAWGQSAASDEEAATPVDASENDSPGFVPTAEAAAFTLGGFLDLGFAHAGGDGTSFHPADRRLPIDYAVDAFAPAVNSRGDVASIDSGGRFTNGFLPRSVGIGGRPSFLINDLAVELRRAGPGNAVSFFARAHLLPRVTTAGNQTRLELEQAFGRVQPFADSELFVFLGKFDSVFGIEYLETPSPLRTGVTPSLFARYTTGTSVGAKLLGRLQLAPLASVVTVNVAATNGGPFIEALHPADISLTGRPVVTGRLGWEFNLPGVQLKLGGSASRGPRNDQGDPEAGARMVGADARVTLFGISLAGEWIHVDEDAGTGKVTGAGAQLIASGFHVRGGWAQLGYRLPWTTSLFRRTALYARGEQRHAWFQGFTHVKERRLTIGARLDLGEAVALKAERVMNQERQGAPDVDNDVQTASLVWVF